MLSVLRSSLRLPTFAVNQLSLASPLAIGWTLAIFSTVASSLVTPLARGAVVGGLNPVTLLLVRLIIATGLLTGTALVTNPALLRIDRRALWRLGVIGLIAGVEICCFFSSLAYMDATMTAMIKSVQPLVVLLWLMLAGERLTGRHWMRLALSMAGLYLLIGVGGYVEPMGLLLLTLSILLYSAILVLSQWWLSEYDSRVITFYLTSIMTVVIAIWWWVRDIGWQNPTMHGWIVIVVLAAVSTWMAKLALYVALPRIGSGQIALLWPVQTLVAIVLSVIFLHERLTAVQWAGGALILTSALLAADGWGRLRGYLAAALFLGRRP
jgi:drug/metabolite transporter (DMT)-like permease